MFAQIDSDISVSIYLSLWILWGQVLAKRPLYSWYTSVRSSFSRHRNFTLSSSISAQNYTTTNDINDPPTLTFSTKANIQESSEPFTTRVSAETTTSGNVFSSSDFLSVDSTIDNHDSTHTITDDLHYTDSATDKTTNSQGPTLTVIGDLTSKGNVLTAIDDIHSTEAATNKTTESHATTQTVIENLTSSNENILTATVDIHSSDSATDKTNSISLASTEPTNSQNDSTTPIQNFNTSTESTNSNTSLNHQFS